jgi:fluoride ion exporter CrcB/FEX
VAAFVATVLLFALVRRESGDPVAARRSLWFLSLSPAAFVLVMGYAESTLLCLSIGCFLALRPAAAASAHRPNFALAALLGFLGALTRPIGVLLALAVVVELVRWWVRLGRSQRLAGLGATAAPVLGLVVFGLWAHHEVGNFFAPLRVQVESGHHGGLSDPFVTLFHDAKGLFHHHVGTALHVPWVVVALGLLVVCWRRLPASYTLFAAAIVGVALAGSNLDSFERYALSAFPLTMAAALLCRGPRIERVVLVVLPAALAGYALLAFLNISVP